LRQTRKIPVHDHHAIVYSFNISPSVTFLVCKLSTLDYPQLFVPLTISALPLERGHVPFASPALGPDDPLTPVVEISFAAQGSGQL
jgi:hypothetical protein